MPSPHSPSSGSTISATPSIPAATARNSKRASPTINARHSPKYFGLKKGVVSYTLVANHVPVNAQIIGANDHESHYVFDILFNNTTDIQPDVHSTDTHGTNEVNFALLHVFGYQFAPRYRDIYDKVRQRPLRLQAPEPV